MSTGFKDDSRGLSIGIRELFSIGIGTRAGNEQYSDVVKDSASVLNVIGETTAEDDDGDTKDDISDDSIDIDEGDMKLELFELSLWLSISSEPCVFDRENLNLWVIPSTSNTKSGLIPTLKIKFLKT